MGISERREREKTERRQAILNSAKELVLSHGVEHISMDNIAEKAELSKATLYLYFSGKEHLLKEICEEAAKMFLTYLKSLHSAGFKGMAAIKYIWRGYVEMFGNSREMFVVFHVRKYLDSWMPIISMDGKDESSSVNKILAALKELIDECKAEGIFDPNLDSTAATRLLLSLFFLIVEHASSMPAETKEVSAVIEDMTNTFQIIIRGFAKEGIKHSLLDIKSL